ncbi:hypothetical protein WN990_39290, partial [Kitasatospora purpeofusca]
RPHYANAAGAGADTGASTTFTSDTPYVGDDFDDTISSLRVRALPATGTAAGIQGGNNTPGPAAYLQDAGAGPTVVPGDFSTITDFTLSYQ